MSGHGATQLRHGRLPRQRGDRGLVAGRDTAGDHGDLVQGQLTGPQRDRGLDQLGPPSGDPDHVPCVRRGQAGAHDQVVLGGLEPAVTPVPVGDELGGDVDQLGLRPVQPSRDRGGVRPQLLLPAVPGLRERGGGHALIVHVFERLGYGPRPRIRL